MKVDLGAKEHSIVSTAFAVGFNRNITPEEVASLQPVVDSLKIELPQVQEILSAKVEVQPGGSSHTQNFIKSGLSLQCHARDGSVEWKLAVSDDHIIVQCFKYTRWLNVWDKAKSYLGSVLTGLRVAAPSLKLTAATLTVTDNFSMNCHSEDYDYTALFSKNCPYLTRNMEKVGPDWHVHQGWFEFLKGAAAGRMLQQLNLGSLGHDSRVVVTIEHVISFRLASPILMGDLGAAATNSVDTYFQRGHSENKTILKKLLNDGMAARIQLNVEKNHD